MADALYRLGKIGQAITFYQRAADLRASTILEYMSAREKVAKCHVETGDYHNALVVLTEVAGMAEQHGGKPVGAVYADVLGRYGAVHVFLSGFIHQFFFSKNIKTK